MPIYRGYGNTIDDLDKAEELGAPNSRYIYGNRGYVHLMRGNIGQALADF